MMGVDPQTALNLIFGTTGGGVVAALVLRTIWRRWSRDAVELAKDRAENDIIITYKDDNKRLRDEINVLAKERNDAASIGGRLEAQVEIFKETIKRLEAENQTLRIQVAEQMKIIHSITIRDTK